MGLPRDTWWRYAEPLKIGEKKRRPHACGEGTPLLVSRDDKGYHAWCFRCSPSDGPGFVPPPAESLTEKLERITKQKAGDASLGATLPEPAERNLDAWPENARLWLYSAGLDRSMVGRLGIYYHRGSDRVVVPCGQRELGFYQARAYQAGRMPKYLGPTPRPPQLLARFGQAEVPTLTEDILSAMKIGMVAEGWAVLGTTVSEHMVAQLMKRGACNVWLDPDAAGRRGAAKIIKRLTAYGVRVRNIVSERDPKRHSLADIKDYLGS
jgi:hypothetical protein